MASGKQTGVGLVEVLVAVLVLSIGMLGLAGLQMRTLRNNQSSLERGVAVVETHAIADAMRADLNTATQLLQYNISLTAPAPGGATFHETVLRGWRNNLIATLGTGATGAVLCDGPVCLITIQWDDSRGTEGSATQTITTTVHL